MHVAYGGRTINSIGVQVKMHNVGYCFRCLINLARGPLEATAQEALVPPAADSAGLLKLRSKEATDPPAEVLPALTTMGQLGAPCVHVPVLFGIVKQTSSGIELARLIIA